MITFKKIFIATALVCAATTSFAQKKGTADVWLTKADQSVLFQKQAQPLTFTKQSNTDSAINVNTGQTYQSIDGFGFTLTGGSAQLMMKMTPAARKALIDELFATNDNNIGISYLRLSIGASDLNEFVFSYDDLPAGQTDPTLAKFDLGPDKKDVVPVLKEILAINPRIKILGSPWSAPVWMKTNSDARGGSLKPDCFDVYAHRRYCH
jgi:glucosylceramidase